MCSSDLMIIVDVFTSDSIPLHLMTIDAVKMYLSKLEENGLLFFHISNKHINLEPQLYALSKILKLNMLSNLDIPGDTLGFPSRWVVLTRNQAAANTLQQTLNWHVSTEKKTVAVWTDDFSNIVGVLS